MMARPYATTGQVLAINRPWRRRRPRQGWVRQDIATIVGTMLAALPSLPRAELARITTRMIDRLDDIDGDPDFERLRDDDEDGHDREQETTYE